jgi:N-acetylneuraminic acid mutarotase
VYGTLGTPAAGNFPGARIAATSWTDSNGNLWLFGGDGIDSVGVQDNGYLNDLWEYNPATNQWAWMAGSSTTYCSTPGIGDYCAQPGVYSGTPGTYTDGNVPAGRFGAVGWTDGSGNLWLFGGFTMVEAGAGSSLNDLWEYNPTLKEWTWMAGIPPEICWTADGCDDHLGVYGPLGTLSASNFPGVREFSATWTDSSGNFWLFGGQGSDSDNDGTMLNDLWKFNPSTSEWAWMSGSSIGSNPLGVYGTQGTAAQGNTPGGRWMSSSWTDSSGNLWLFGGQGYGTSNGEGYLSDLWMYSPSTGYWTWMSGSSTVDQSGQFGTQAVKTGSESGKDPLVVTAETATSGGLPGGRWAGLSWTDQDGNLVLFGGYGLGASSSAGYLNDLWKYQVTPSVFSLAATTPSGVTPGATATSTVTVSTTNGYAGTISLTCALTKSPSGAAYLPTCTNAGSTVTLSGTTKTTSATFIVGTTAATSAMARPDQGRGQRWAGAGGGAILAFVLFLGIPARRRGWLSMLGIMALFAALGGMAACGSGGAGGGTSGTSIAGTTAGKYTFTVTGTGSPSITPAPTATFTLTVN